MKRYKDYMDNLEVSDTLHEKLKNLEEPKKKSQPWAKWGATAAALVLVAGVGAWGLSRDSWNALMDNFKPAAEVAPEIAEIGRPDIAFEDPNDPYAPADRTDGGYELINGEFVSYYVLPYLNWADASALPQTSLDYSLAAPSAISRGATWDDVEIFMGGEKAMSDHLLWDEGMNWSGTLWFAEDGTPQAAALSTGYANWGYGFCLSLEVMKGGKVPSCIRLPDEYYETSQWQGVEITALKNGGYMIDDDGVVLTEKREVSLYSNGTGYKLTLYAHDADRADELCARFVRYAVAGGFQLDALAADGTVREADPGWSVGDPNWEDGVSEEDSSCPYCADGTVHTHPYDPSATN